MQHGRMRFIFSLLVLTAMLLISPSLVQASSIRPIEDFTNVQGTKSSQFVPPLGDFVGWTTCAAERSASVDYAGIAARYLKARGIDLHTTMSGSITERPLAGGKVQVKVILHTKNALTWVIPYNCDTPGDFPYRDNQLLFGNRASDVLAGATPALGGSELQVVFNMAAGQPMPDLAYVLFVEPRPDFELISIYFYANSSGPLHAASGLGSEGAPARAVVVQTGVNMRGPFKGATADGFPAERIDLHPTGK